MYHATINPCLQTSSLVRIEAIVTSLVFDHALRIRLIAEAAEVDNSATSGTASPPGSSTSHAKGSTTSVAAFEGDEGNETAHSRTATNVSVATAVSPIPATREDVTKDAAKGPAKKQSNLVGKINNLVTSDLDNIAGGGDIMFFGERPLLVVSSGKLIGSVSGVNAAGFGAQYVVLVRSSGMEVSWNPTQYRELLY